MKVCLVGSAPSSVKLQPYADTSWKIWACSPGCTPHLQRVDAFFEVHRWEPKEPWFPLDYRAWLNNLRCPVYMIEPQAEVQASIAYPKDEMVRKFGPWFWTSTLSWMFALALHQGATEIAFAGVDMSAQEEWQFQRSGCHFFVDLARKMGVKVDAPPESDLLRPPPMYGFREVDPMHIKLLVRDKELTTNIKTAEQKLQAARDELMFFKGAYDNNLYTLKTWVSDPLQIELAYANPEPRKDAQLELGVTIQQVANPNGKGNGKQIDLEEVIKEVPAVNIEAPYGLKKDGTPAKKRGPRKSNGVTHVS